MSYEPTDLVRHAWRKPPRCVAAFVVEPLSAPESAWECWDELALLHLGCPCGSRQFRVLGFPHAEAGLLCPITLECPACGASALLFDIAEHGYDAELDGSCYSMRGEGAPQPFSCSCSGVRFDVFASFSYQIEPIDDLDADVIAHIEDFFDGFALPLRCVACGKTQWASEYECA